MRKPVGAKELRESAGAALDASGLVSRGEFAALLGISTRTLDRLVKRGALPAPDGPDLGRLTRWRAATVRGVLEAKQKRRTRVEAVAQ